MKGLLIVFLLFWHRCTGSYGISSFGPAAPALSRKGRNKFEERFLRHRGGSGLNNEDVVPEENSALKQPIVEAANFREGEGEVEGSQLTNAVKIEEAAGPSNLEIGEGSGTMQDSALNTISTEDSHVKETGASEQTSEPPQIQTVEGSEGSEIIQEAIGSIHSLPPIHYVAHSISVKECLEVLAVTLTEGLSTPDALSRLAWYGENAMKAPPVKSLLRLVIEQFQDRLVQILLGVAFSSAVLASLEHDLHAFAEPVIILSILLINAAVGVMHSRSAENSLDALKKLQPQTACVLRDGKWNGDFPASSLVPGDILHLRVGDRVPADARVVELKTTSFSTDEGSLTGESTTVSKAVDPVDAASSITGKANMVFGGTLVATGGSYAVVTATGMTTEIGAINAGVQSAQEEDVKTPLAVKLDRFGDDLSKIILIICATMWLVNIPQFSSPVFGSWVKGAIHHAKVAVAVGVAAIPEGLPAVITLCLSLGTARMATKNVIVRKLPAVETLGCTSVICTDKTGTLTTNMMVVKSLVTFSATAVPAVTLGEATDEQLHAEIARRDKAKGERKEKKSSAAKREKKRTTTDGTTSGDDDDLNKKPVAVEIVEREVEGISYQPVGRVVGLEERDLLGGGFKDLCTIMALCNEAALEFRDNDFVRIGEPTEAALLVLVEKLGAIGFTKASNPLEMANQCTRYWSQQYDKLATLEFNRDRKSMSVLCSTKSSPAAASATTSTAGKSKKKIKEAEHANRLFVKGAAEMVLSRCSRVKLEDGTVVPLTDAYRSTIQAKFEEMACRPLRCLAMAYRDGSSLGALNTLASADEATSSPLLKNPGDFASWESDLVLVGMCGIKDPARPEAAAAIVKCNNAGIRVMMMTGDSKETAVAIAKEVNILSPSDNIYTSAFTGSEFFSLDHDSQIELLREGNKVFCRTEPKDKQRLISMLAKLGEVTAMTGDGVNDAPALQQADIGIAMGITGTEVAKGAADMVLADDNFATIVTAVEEGRNIFSNMQAFVCFLIACNIGEIALVFFASLVGIPEPLGALHLLWVNLVTDGPPATALSFNPADPAAMKAKPRSRNESIMSAWLLARYIITGVYVGLSAVGAFVWWYVDKGVTWEQLRTWTKCLSWTDFAHTGLSSTVLNCDIFTVAKARPQSMALSVLVTVEMLKALSAVSLDNSLLRVPPWKNKWLVFSVVAAFALHLAVLYVPVLAGVLGLAPLTWREWKVVLAFSLPVLLLEEILKFVGRHRATIGSVASEHIKAAERQAIKRMPPPPHF